MPDIKIHSPRGRALRGGLAYGAIALLWILLSDWLVFFSGLYSGGPIGDPARVGTVKGILFVLFTTALLYTVLRREFAESGRLADYQRALIEASPLAVFDLTRDGRVKSQWNPAAERMFGFRRDEVMGKLLPIVPKDRLGEFSELRERVFAGEAFDDVELIRRRKDGSEISILVASAPVVNEQGKVDTVVSVVADITERKAIESALHASLDDKRDLLREVQHRVKNNLQVILSLIRIGSSLHLENGGENLRLEKLRRQVGTMAVVHDQVHTAEDVRGVDLRRCLYDLTARFRSELSDLGHPLEVRIDAEELVVPLDVAISTLLVAEELIDAVLARRSPGSAPGVFDIVLDQNSAPFALTVGFSGTVAIRPFDKDELRLAEALAVQIGCRLRVDYDSTGVRLSVESS